MKKIVSAGIFFSIFSFSFFLYAADSPSNYDIALEFLKKEEYDPAIENFQKALQDEKDAIAQSRIYNLLGLSYLKQGVSSSSAIGSFEQAIRMDPQFAEAYFNIASAYAADNLDPNKAADYFQKTIEVDPNYSKAYFGLGWFSLMQKENPEQAIEFFQKTLDKYPDFAEAYYGMGLAYIRMRKPHMALGAVSHLRDLKKDDLAFSLEKAVVEVSPPGDSVVEEGGGSNGSQAGASSRSSGQEGSRASPFEVTMKGKITPAKEKA